MRLLCWNIQQGGGRRLPRIVEEISAYDADVVAVTEYRTVPGIVLSAALQERGFAYFENTNPTGNQNGIAVFSRTPMLRTRTEFAPADSLVRWLDIELPEYGFGIGVLHIMAAASGAKSPATVAKTRFWEAVLEAAKARLDEPFLFIGDWNTGAHLLDEAGKTFVCTEQFGRLSGMGWIDMWRRQMRARRNGRGTRRSRAACAGMDSGSTMPSLRRGWDHISRRAATRTRNGTPEYPITR
jgi:exodeoxyribonuclease-3